MSFLLQKLSHCESTTLLRSKNNLYFYEKKINQGLLRSRLRVEIEPLGQMILGHGRHEVAGDRIALVEMLALVLLHQHVHFAHHLDELELVGASTEHGHQAFDERRAVGFAVRDESSPR